MVTIIGYERELSCPCDAIISRMIKAAAYAMEFRRFKTENPASIGTESMFQVASLWSCAEYIDLSKGG